MAKKKIKNILKKQIIYVDIDDEVTDIFERIRKNRIMEIFIVIPKGSVIFQSSVNLKILKKKVKEIGKKMSIITNDPNGTQLSIQSEIPVFKNMEETQDEIPGKKTMDSPDKDVNLAISPITATSNELEEDNPKRISQKKISISEILQRRRIVKQRKGGMIPKEISGSSKKAEKNNDNHKEVADFRPSRKTIITLIAISVILLLVIGYIALPGATISLTPKSSILSSSANIVFADAKRKADSLKRELKHVISTYPIAKTVSFKGIYPSTGKNFTGTNSKGILTIINTSNHGWPLIKETRFQSPEGYIFRIKKAVTIPAATANGPGTLDIEVEADPFDAFNRVVGEKGNIGPSKFFLPGLRENSREELYAENKVQFSGGTTTVTPVVTQEDLEAANIFVKDNLSKKVLSELLIEVDKYNQLQNTKLSLLTGDKALVYGDIKVTIPKSSLGQELSEIEVSGEMPVKGVMYNHSELLRLLTEEVKKSQSPDRKLTKIENDSLDLKIIESDSSLSEIKTTTSIKALEEYAIDLTGTSGLRLSKKIKERVAGLTVEEAHNLIQNLPEINNVEIKSWPLWAPKMPTMLDNIHIRIAD